MLFRSEQQKLRRHRIKHVRGADAAVGVVFLAELERLAVFIGNDFSGGKTLAISQRAEADVIIPADISQIGHQFVIKRRAAFL